MYVYVCMYVCMYVCNPLLSLDAPYYESATARLKPKPNRSQPF